MIGIIKIEQQVLNCLWDDPKLLYTCNESYFISGPAEDIYITMQILNEAGVDCSVTNVVAYGNERNQGITTENVTQLRTQEYLLKDFPFYFKNLKKNYAKHQIENKLLKETTAAVSTKGELNVENLERLLTEMQTNLDIITGKESLLKTLPEIGDSYYQVLLDRQNGLGKYSTGDAQLDKRLTLGFAPGQITTLFGATGIGKSMFALNLVSKQINRQIPCMYITMEMDDISTMDRLIAIRQRASAKTFHADENGDLSNEAFSILARERISMEAHANRFFLVDSADLSISDVETLIKETQKRMGVKYLVCTIDLATMLTDMGDDASAIEQSMNRLSAMAKRLGVHLVLIVQANRQVDAAGASSMDQINRLKPKSMSGIKNSASFGERSRIILSVFRKKYYAKMLFPDDPELETMDDIFEVTVLKQSQGEAGTEVKYLYEPECFRCYPYFNAEEDLKIDLPSV